MSNGTTTKPRAEFRDLSIEKMRRGQDMTGVRFGRLVVTSEAPRSESLKYHRQVVVKCDCGNEETVALNNLRGGKIVSCGCARAESARSRKKHGLSKDKSGTPEYRVWCNMRCRCNNPNTRSYRFYGAKGIKVCPRWDSFEAFLEDMGRRPDATYSIERLDPAADYYPENCCWIPLADQAANKRTRREINWNGQVHSLAEWARLCGLTPATLWKRLSRGWDIGRALTTSNGE